MSNSGKRKADDALRREGLAQILGTITFQENLGLPDPEAAALFGSRNEDFLPSSATLMHGGKRKQFTHERADKFAEYMCKLEEEIKLRG
jgi:hypothetical protein